MALYETEALVLRTYNLSEADKIVVFMTQNKGIIRGVAKGAKRLKSKFGGSLESSSIVHLTFIQKEERELVAIRDIDLLKSFFADTTNIHFLQKFEYLAELLIEFSPPSDPNERLYKMSKICLLTASENPEFLDSVVLYFELWVLRLGGFLPVWDKCQKCRRIVPETESANLNFEFQMICTKCQANRKGFFIKPIQRQFYSIAQKVSPQKFIDITRYQDRDLVAVSSVLKRIISRVLGKEVSDKKILISN